MSQAASSSVPTRIAQLAGRVSRGVRLLAIISAVSAIWVWSAVFYPFVFSVWWGWVLALVLLTGLQVPAVILLLTHMALHELINLPNRMRQAAETSKGRAVKAAGEVKERTRWWVGRAAWDLWRLVGENKELLLGYTGLVRLLNPVTLVVVLAAVALTALLVATAAVAGLALLI